MNYGTLPFLLSGCEYLKNTMLNTKRDTFELSMQQKIKGIESR